MRYALLTVLVLMVACYQWPWKFSRWHLAWMFPVFSAVTILTFDFLAP